MSHCYGLAKWLTFGPLLTGLPAALRNHRYEWELFVDWCTVTLVESLDDSHPAKTQRDGCPGAELVAATHHAVCQAFQLPDPGP